MASSPALPVPSLRAWLPTLAAPSNALLLTASSRLATALRDEFEALQLAAGRRAWETPAIFSLDAWLARAWSGAGTALCLAPPQELLLWEQIIADSPADSPLLDIEATARAAAQAWQLCHDWNLPATTPEWNQTDETQSFRAWADRFHHACAQSGWITAAQLPALITARIASAALSLPPTVALVGFDELNPRQLALLQAFRDAGASVVELSSATAPATLRCLPSPDAAEELRAAARWARQCLRENPAANIGVVVPDLQASRSQVERAFNAEFHPALPPWSAQPRDFHISLGQPLAASPAVAAALELLRTIATATAPVDIAALGSLLRSPFLAPTPAQAQSWLSWELKRRRHREFAVPLAELPYRDGCAGWPRRQGHAAWAAAFSAWLQAAGWPGDRPLDSPSFQAIEAWNRALAALARLDEVAPSPVTPQQALQRLASLATQSTFQPRAPRPAPRVQILGWLEAAGLSFDHLWVTGLHDEVLPAPARPHPFLPLELQRRLGLPHASAAREADFADRLLLRLRQSAPDLIASYPQRRDDFDLSPSPLLQAAEPCEPPGGIETPAPLPVTPETLDDSRGPALPPDQRHASVAVFTDHAACAFRAFVHQRLHAAELPTAPQGLDAMSRGTLLHEILQRVWQTLQSQAVLLKNSPGDLAQLVEGHAAAVVAADPRLRSRPGLTRLEQDRLARLTLQWLELEKSRPPFSVLATEQERRLEFDGLDLHLRLDRVDQLAGGGRVLIDYKSGTPSKGDWDTSRPNQPQLPLYLVTDPDPSAVDAIAFAQLAPGDLSLKAAARRPGIFTRSANFEDWEARIATWRQVLEALAQNFIAGDAAVLPKTAATCDHCDLGLLCRFAASDTARGQAGRDEALASADSGADDAD